MECYSGHLPPDFRVSYRLFSTDEGGRKTLPFQHIRWGFAYEDETISTQDKIFMIWPEFVTSSGEMLPEGVHMPKQDLADMFILNPAFREFHGQHIKMGFEAVLEQVVVKSACVKSLRYLRFIKIQSCSSSCSPSGATYR